MVEIICNEIYCKAPNSIYRVNNEANVVELGLLRPVLSVASPLACPLVIQVEQYALEECLTTGNIAVECEHYGWYANN